MSIDDSQSHFRDWLVAQGCSLNTVRERVTMIRAFGRFVAADPRSVTSDQVMAYLSRDFSPWTRATYWSHLSSWFAYLRATSARLDSPLDALVAPKSPSAKPRPLSPAEEDRLMSGANPMHRTWLVLSLFAGLRASEIAKLRGVDVTEQTLFVHGKGGREDYLPTHPMIWAEAQQHDAGYWFPSHGASGHLRPETVSENSGRYFRSQGVEGAIHRCRHTYATKLLRAGVNIRVVQTLMRHSSLATTQMYLAVDDAERRSAVMLLPSAA